MACDDRSRITMMIFFSVPRSKLSCNLARVAVTAEHAVHALLQHMKPSVQTRLQTVRQILYVFHQAGVRRFADGDGVQAVPLEQVRVIHLCMAPCVSSLCWYATASDYCGGHSAQRTSRTKRTWCTTASTNSVSTAPKGVRLSPMHQSSPRHLHAGFACCWQTWW